MEEPVRDVDRLVQRRFDDDESDDDAEDRHMPTRARQPVEPREQSDGRTDHDRKEEEVCRHGPGAGILTTRT